MNKKYFDANKELWDEFAKIHYETESESYSVKSFLEGQSTLKSYELREMGNVKGKSLLHLQCHFGLDTLSWAREGAIVTGIDISSEGIRLAKLLAKRAKLEAQFIESNLYDSPKVLFKKFDIVYTSIGVLCWLNDLKEWGAIISHFLKPGGFFYIAEIHPFSMVFDNETKTAIVQANTKAKFASAVSGEKMAQGLRYEYITKDEAVVEKPLEKGRVRILEIGSEIDSVENIWGISKED